MTAEKKLHVSIITIILWISKAKLATDERKGYEKCIDLGILISKARKNVYAGLNRWAHTSDIR